ncbi:hypothetical protein IWX49DRAFT_112628 [Phyllosticta citricarpa]
MAIMVRSRIEKAMSKFYLRSIDRRRPTNGQLLRPHELQFMSCWQDSRRTLLLPIETKDEILDMLRDTRLSDADSWRRAIQSVPLVERGYLQEVMDMLREYRRKWEEEGSSP